MVILDYVLQPLEQHNLPQRGFSFLWDDRARFFNKEKGLFMDILTRSVRLFRLHGFALATLLSFGSAVQATVVVEAISNSDGLSLARVLNGALVGGGNNIAAPNGTSNAGPIGPGATSAFANTTQLEPAGSVAASASADLATGALRSNVLSGGPGQQANATSRWTDTITFNNVSGVSKEFGFSWRTDGTVFHAGTGTESITSQILLTSDAFPHGSIIHLKDLPDSNLGGSQFNYLTSGPNFTFQPVGNNDAGAWTTSFIGTTGGLIAATLIVPTGLSDVTFSAYLNLDCRSGSNCDYSHTSQFAFGALPRGLTWTSESGVFLSGVAAPVPLPSALLFMGTGLAGLLGAGRTQRRLC